MARANTNPTARRLREAGDRIARAVSQRGAALGDPVLSELSCCHATGYRDRAGRRFDLDGRAHVCAQEGTTDMPPRNVVGPEPTTAIILANMRLAETGEHLRSLRDWPGADDTIRAAVADAGAHLDAAAEVMARLPDLIAHRTRALA